MQKVKKLIIPFRVGGVLVATSCNKNEILPDKTNEVLTKAAGLSEALTLKKH